MSDIIAIVIKGGIVMIPLLLCSVIALAVTIERFIYWRQIRSKKPVEQMLEAVEQGKFPEALSQGKGSPLPAARVLAAGLAHRNPSYSKAMEVAPQAEMPILKRRLVILDTIITLAPLLGLLGTIVGIWLWTGVLLWLEAFDHTEEALYFAIVAYTTVGYGDIIAPPDWRILGATIAANGMLGFGIATAALIDLVLRTQNELRG